MFLLAAAASSLMAALLVFSKFALVVSTIVLHIGLFIAVGAWLSFRSSQSISGGKFTVPAILLGAYLIHKALSHFGVREMRFGATAEYFAVLVFSSVIAGIPQAVVATLLYIGAEVTTEKYIAEFRDKD